MASSDTTVVSTRSIRSQATQRNSETAKKPMKMRVCSTSDDGEPIQTMTFSILVTVASADAPGEATEFSGCAVVDGCIARVRDRCFAGVFRRMLRAPFGTGPNEPVACENQAQIAAPSDRYGPASGSGRLCRRMVFWRDRIAQVRVEDPTLKALVLRILCNAADLHPVSTTIDNNNFGALRQGRDRLGRFGRSGTQ